MTGATLSSEEGRRLGADRVLEPEGALPQQASRLDSSGPLRPLEIEVAVDRLCLDATSFREIRRSCGAEPRRIAERIDEIVTGRGKMHNPHTGSGGVAVGSVTAVGSDRASDDAPAIGARIVTLASLTLVPLRLDEVVAVDPDSPQVEVRGTAYLCERAPWAELPDDIPDRTALELLDVYAAATHTRDLAPRGGTVVVLGAGHAGRLALAAARAAGATGKLVVVDRDPAALAPLLATGLCDLAVEADLSDPLGALEAVRRAGGEPAELAVVVVDAPGCEAAAILLTDERGTVLFFSMATGFQAAALTADGMSSAATLLIGNGFASDRGSYALELARTSAPLRAVLGLDGEAVAP